MSINSISNQYLQLSQTQGTSGDGGSVQVNYADDVLTFTEADGDTYSIDAFSLSDADIEMLSSTLGVEVTKDAEGANGANRSGELKESAEQKEAEIEKVSDEIGDIYDETLEEQEKITKNEYQRILDVVNNSVAQFMEARKSGKQVDVSDLNDTITAGVENSTYEQDIAEVFGNLEGANSKIQQMSTLLREYGTITEEAQALDSAEIEKLQSDANKEYAEQQIAMIESSSLGFLCNNFFEIYQEKLDGHKEQFNLVSGFRDLDDGIIQMYTEYANSAASTVQELLNKEEKVGAKEENKENDKKVNKVETASVEAEEEDEDKEEEKEAKAA